MNVLAHTPYPDAPCSSKIKKELDMSLYLVILFQLSTTLGSRSNNLASLTQSLSSRFLGVVMTYSSKFE